MFIKQEGKKEVLKFMIVVDILIRNNNSNNNKITISLNYKTSLSNLNTLVVKAQMIKKQKVLWGRKVIR